MNILRQILIELVTLFQGNPKIVTNKHDFVTPSPKNTKLWVTFRQFFLKENNCDKIFHF